MNYDWNVYMSFLNPVLPMHILLRRFLMEWNEGNGVHTYRVPPPARLAWTCARARRQEAACGSGKFKRGGTKNGGGKTQNTQMHRRIAVLRHSHSTTVPVPTLSLEHAQQVVRIPLHYRLRAKFKQALGDGRKPEFEMMINWR